MHIFPRKRSMAPFGLAAVGIALASLSFFTTSAQAAQIKCPASITYGVTSNVPNGWRSSRTALRFTKAEMRGNQLHCVYGRTIKLTRTMPANTNCRTNRRGFLCAGVREQRQGQLVRSGNMLLQGNTTGDLDSGRTAARSGADIHFVNGGIRAVGRARFGSLRNQPVGFAGCGGRAYAKRSIRAREISTGKFFCMKTSSGQYSEIMIGNGTNRNRLALHFRTWR